MHARGSFESVHLTANFNDSTVTGLSIDENQGNLRAAQHGNPCEGQLPAAGTGRVVRCHRACELVIAQCTAEASYEGGLPVNQISDLPIFCQMSADRFRPVLKVWMSAQYERCA